jgi:hypothetical protein
MDRPAYRDVGFEGGRRRIKPNVFARIIRAVLRWRLLVVVLWTVLAVAGATFFRTTASIDMRADGLVRIDPTIADAERALAAAFPGTGEPIVAVVDAGDPRAARQAAAALAQAMSAEPRRFRDVFAPGTGTFFDEFGVLYLDKGRIEDIVRRIEQSAPLYRAIAASPDLGGFGALALQAARAISEGRSPQGLNALFLEAAETVKGRIQNARHDLDWPGLLKYSGSPDNTRWYVLAVPVFQAGEWDPERSSVLAARDLASAVVAKASGPVSVTLTGRPVLRAEPMGAPLQAILLPAVLSALLVMVVLGFGLTRPSLVIANLFSLAFGTMTFAGAVALISPRLDRLSISAMVIYFSSAALATIAMSLRAEQYQKADVANNTALMLAGHRLGSALFAWSLAIPIGCLAAYHSDFVSLINLVHITAVALPLAFLTAMTALPALLSLMWPASALGESHWLDLVADEDAPPAWAKLRQGLTVLLVVTAVLFGPLVAQIKIEIHPPPRTVGKAAQLFAELAGREPALLTAAHVLSPPGRAAGELAARLAKLPQVASVRWIESFLPPEEEQKRAILARLEGVLPHVPEAAPASDEAKLRADLSRLEQSLLDIANNPHSAAELRKAANELRRGLALLDKPDQAWGKTIRDLQDALFVRLPQLFQRVERLSSLPPLSLGRLDPDIVRHYVGPDGSWRIEVAPRDPAAVAGFAEAVSSIAPAATSIAFVEQAMTSVMRNGLGTVIAGMLVALLVAAAVVTRGILASLRIIIPPLLLVLIAGGWLVLTARGLRPEEISLAIVAIAMSSGAGLIAEQWDGDPNAWIEGGASAMARAILLAEILLAAAFATLMLSGWRQFNGFGGMTAGVVVALFAASFVVGSQLRHWTRWLQD